MEPTKTGEVAGDNNYKTESGHDPKFLSRVARQVADEFKVGEDHVRNRRASWRSYLKLYLNQRKNPRKVGDTLMFSTHQTILAALYKDRLDAEWNYREEGDIDRVEAVNALWAFDYDEMGKPQHDYDRMWDASFYGVALEDWSHFDKATNTPIPDLWDPMATVVDPKATSINGNRLRRGAARFLYRDVMRTMREMEAHGGYFDLKQLEPSEAEAREMEAARQARDDARGLDSSWPDDVEKNRTYALKAGYTWIDGKRYLVEAGKDATVVVRLQRVMTDYWPVQDSYIYPMPHTSVMGMPGCPDFTEDKQRAKATLQNYTLDAAKYDVLPMWLFDRDKIVNKQQLREFRAGKMVEGKNLDGNAIFPMTKPSLHQFVSGIQQELEMNAQKALATPEIQQGILFAQKRTATEISEASANVETRYSLTASLFAIPERNGAMMWLDLYKRHFKLGTDKKSARISGPFGPKLVPIEAETFKFEKDPDVTIESRFLSQAKKRQQLNSMSAYSAVLVATPGSNMRYFAKKFGRLMFTKDEVDRFVPPSLDEMRAEDENERLGRNSLEGVEIEPTDDHKIHLEIHGKAPETKAKLAHVKAHRRAMMMQRNSPELFQGIQVQEPLPGQQPGMPGQQEPPPTPQGAIQELIQQ